MSKRSRRPGREAIKAQLKERKKAQRELRAAKKAQGLEVPSSATISNRKCDQKTEEEERAARLDAVKQQVKVYRSQLPVLLARLSKINDPRNPKKIRHKMSVLMIYGILCFAFQMASRREATRELTRPVFMANLRELFPELEDLPHHDTLARILDRIDVNEIEHAHIEMIRHLIRGKKFQGYLIAGCYPIAIDGTQKFTRAQLWDLECLERKLRTQKKDEEDKKEPEEKRQYYVYVLEANLAFRNGWSFPCSAKCSAIRRGTTTGTSRTANKEPSSGWPNGSRNVFHTFRSWSCSTVFTPMVR